MLYKEGMKGTNRIAIKCKNGIKLLISKSIVNDSEQLLFYFPENMPVIAPMPIEDDIVEININTPKNALFITKIEIKNENIILYFLMYTNVVLEFCDDDDYSIDTYYMSTYEPEEDNERYVFPFYVEEIKEIIADPDLFIELLNSGVITGSEVALQKYDVLPKIRMYRGKGRGRKPKIKYVK